MLIEPQFFPPVQFITKFLLNESVIIDDLGYFQKQTYRNRACIVSANKVQSISIPLQKGKTHQMMKDVKIDYGKNWQRELWVAIQSAYGKTPFFDFYAPQIELIIKTRYTYLLDLDLESLKISLSMLGIPARFKLSSEYEGEAETLSDYRSSIHPKKGYAWDEAFHPMPYLQAFQERFGFIPNLSVLDLLFNEGPEGKRVLQQSIRY